MGKKDTSKKEEAPPSNAPAKDEEEDSACIKKLKEIDERYCAERNALDAEIEKLRQKYAEKQAPILEERKKLLSTTANDASQEDKENGTPGCPDFWLTALSNEEDFGEVIQDNDSKPLSYLQDIKASYLDADNVHKGSRVEFHFGENPYFSNAMLFVEVHLDAEQYKPWKEQPVVLEIKASDVDWKAGKDVTVAKTKPAATKKGKKKAASKEEPCDSFFRVFFSSVKKGDSEAFLEKLSACYPMEEMEDEDEDMLEEHMGRIASYLEFMHQQFIPYAVRYYTGEACEDDDDDEDGESGSDLDESDDDDDESEDERPAPKGKGKKPSPSMKPKNAPAGGEKQEECKQQ